MQTISVSSDLKGIEIAKEKLYEAVDKKTVLYLSGGRTPAPLYRKFAKDPPAGRQEKLFRPGAVAIVDERWGKPMHGNSNEKMIKDVGFWDYLKTNGVPFYGVLENKSLTETAKDYDETVRYLLKWFPKNFAVLGMGSDGHIASIPAGNEKLRTKNEKLVEEFDDFPGEQKERISLTFNALSQMDQIFLLVFGNDKKKALKAMFADGPIEEIPARFLNTPQVTDKVLLITDQKV